MICAMQDVSKPQRAELVNLGKVSSINNSRAFKNPGVVFAFALYIPPGI